MECGDVGLFGMTWVAGEETTGWERVGVGAGFKEGRLKCCTVSTAAKATGSHIAHLVVSRYRAKLGLLSLTIRRQDSFPPVQMSGNAGT